MKLCIFWLQWAKERWGPHGTHHLNVIWIPSRMKLVHRWPTKRGGTRNQQVCRNVSLIILTLFSDWKFLIMIIWSLQLNKRRPLIKRPITGFSLKIPRRLLIHLQVSGSWHSVCIVIIIAVSYMLFSLPECPVCLDDVKNAFSCDTCKHDFCWQCFEWWLDNGGRNCPLCRGDSDVLLIPETNWSQYFILHISH